VSWEGNEFLGNYDHVPPSSEKNRADTKGLAQNRNSFGEGDEKKIQVMVFTKPVPQKTPGDVKTRGARQQKK